MRRDSLITPADETKAICTSEYSELIPLSGGTVLFSTLAGRPSANEFDTNEELQVFIVTGLISPLENIAITGVPYVYIDVTVRTCALVVIPHAHRTG